MSEIGELTEAVSRIDKNLAVFMAAQQKMCEAAQCQRHTHDLILFGDGTNPDHGLVGGHQKTKAQMEEQGRNIGRLEESVKMLVRGVWGVALLVIVAAATLVWTRVTDDRIMGPTGPRGYTGATGNQGNPGNDYHKTTN